MKFSISVVTFLVAVFLIFSTDYNLALAVNHQNNPIGFFNSVSVAAHPKILYSSSDLFVALKLDIRDKFHLNSDKPNQSYLIPTILTIAPNKDIDIVEFYYPTPNLYKPKYSEAALAVFDKIVFIAAKIRLKKNINYIPKRSIILTLKLKFQACDEFNCYPPAEIIKNITLPIAANPESNNSKSISQLNQQPEWFKILKIRASDENTDIGNSEIIKNEINRQPTIYPQSSKIANSANVMKQSTTQIISAYSFWSALFYCLPAFIGGFILNFMPCVLPALSIKIFGLIKLSGIDRREFIKRNILFIAGIIFSFIVFAVIIIILQRSGRQFGWGFQFQNPAFVSIIMCVIFVFGLNLAGVFGGISSAPSKVIDMLAAAGKIPKGYAAAFFEGILAAVLATPCAAPGLGYALGFALTKPSLIIILIFAAIALGMSAPYFIIALLPARANFLPKPGKWMEYLKQFLAFPMFATVLWLLWIFSRQTSDTVVFHALIFLTILSFICWIYGKIEYINLRRISRIALQLLFAAIIIALFDALIYSQLSDNRKSQANADTKTMSAEIQNYSEELLQSQIYQGKIVFLEFTADWCLTCQWNKKNVLETRKIKELFTKLGIIHIRGDWTNGNPEITNKIREFGRAGVPLYVIYPAVNSNNQPIILPEILTAETIKTTIIKAN